MFTSWIKQPPSMIVDLFNDFRDGSKLLDLLEVMSGQRIVRMFQSRSNIEKALSFLKKKSVNEKIKLVNINIPDLIDGKPSIILGLIWTIILQYHIEELASCLSFDSRQSSMESLASLDTRSPLHSRFRVSAKKALLLWVREQAGCSISIKDFKASWRSGVVFLAILNALRPNLVDLSKARTRSNKQNLEEAFHIAETELRIPRLLDPDDVDVRDPDEKSIMTYVAQFLQYSRDVPAQEEEMQTLISSVFIQLREYRVELDTSLPPPLDTVAQWLLRTEGALAEEQGDPQDHGCAADDAREKQELLKVNNPL
uniref:Calponin-homology (CH) domain-containing protein n=1 Tax=Fundulus heteroclitus TaxID=8078 RepID=A0A3Q2P3I8_FUNHE